MPERGRQFGNHYGSEARMRQRMRFSATAQGVRILQDNAARGVITADQAELVSKMLVGNWAVGRIAEIAERHLDRENEITIFETPNGE